MKNTFLNILFLLYFVFKANTVISSLQHEFSIVFLDIGQGDSILVNTDNRKILIDGGFYYDIDTVLGEYISDLFCHIDIIFPTHVDSDHIGGLNRILDRCSVSQIYFNEVVCSSGLCGEFYGKLHFDKTKSITAGDHYLIDGVDIFVYWPSKEYLEKCKGKREGSGICNHNDTSTVMLVKRGSFESLMTGDAGTEILNRLDISDIMSHVDGELDVYKVPHHGSKNSLTKEFTESINPKYCIISCGEDNRFGHPHKEVIQELERVGCQILRTDELGTIEFKIQ